MLLIYCFNSSIVQLKDGYDYTVAANTTEFQFLYGTIKSGTCVDSKESNLCFNFSMVQLKVIPSDVDKLLDDGFNSSMVQLKGLKFILVVRIVSLFQFLYGTTKSFIILSRYVSIPLWYN